MTIRTLLKSLPATNGMSRNRLFQIVDPNAGQTCTIVTFQKADRLFIEQCNLTLEKELRNVLAPGESSKLFIEDTEGIWFGGNVRKTNGKPIALSVPNKADLDYINQTNSTLNNPPTKRSNDHTSKPHDNSYPPTQIAYRGLVQGHHTQTTQSISIQDTEGTTTTTTTQTSQTVTAMIEARFQTIEAEMQHQKNTQLNMNSCLHTLEHRTESIDSNIAEMMKFWKIAPTQK